mmetsp:Transcript_58135/g.162051  ORF Transcript_58135/g.162051 Transcript_58135/m.162051 type:complete len:214 (+) Transcript_58135:1080-1721(+)
MGDEANGPRRAFATQRLRASQVAVRLQHPDHKRVVPGDCKVPSSGAPRCLLVFAGYTTRVGNPRVRTGGIAPSATRACPRPCGRFELGLQRPACSSDVACPCDGPHITSAEISDATTFASGAPIARAAGPCDASATAGAAWRADSARVGRRPRVPTRHDYGDSAARRCRGQFTPARHSIHIGVARRQIAPSGSDVGPGGSAPAAAGTIGATAV